MAIDSEVLASVLSRLTRDPRVRAKSEGGLVNIRAEHGVIWLTGVVDELAEKKIAELLARESPGVVEVVNDLRVRVHTRRSDAEILRHVRNGLEQDPYLAHRELMAAVDNGVVTLTGTQDALIKKRLAGLIAWWVVGVTEVRNAIAVVPDEPDSDQELIEAVRMAFEKDRLVDSLRYHIQARDGVVTLAGIAPSAPERLAAEHDAWSLWGVREVHNQIAIEA